MANFSLTATLITTLLPVFLCAQKPPQINIVPNPGFEEFSDIPGGWFYSGKDFSRIALYWTSPNASSPDLYTSGVQIPKTWKSIGFGNIQPFQGKSYAGITIYGCDKGKPHCKEYVQIQLAEPLVPGQRYGFACMVAHLPKTVFVKNLQLAFSNHEIDETNHDPILLNPSLELERWIPSDNKWYRWTGHFVAMNNASFLLIGNFNTDDNCQVKMPWKSDLRYGYYYLDDVRIFKVPPILKVPKEDSPLANYVPIKGGIVNLSRIYFEHDRTDFMPQTMIQLKQLLDFLKRYPHIKIEIHGHTDNVGTVEYNQDLSKRRSKAVLNWLVANGIPSERLVSSGSGSSAPLTSNATSIGRSQNRRVEVKVFSL